MRALLAVLLALTFFVIGIGAVRKKSIVPDYEIVKTRNGVPVYFFHGAGIPLFQVELDYNWGSDFDPEKFSGLGMMTASMLKRGVPGMDENMISQTVDDLAAGIDFSVGEERSSVSAYGLNEHAPKILDMLFKQLDAPTFPEKPFERLKTNHLDGIRQLPDSPAALASYVLGLQLMNGTTKARPDSGFRVDVTRIDLEKTKRYYPKMFRTDGLRAMVIGGDDKSEILERVVKGIEALSCRSCGEPRPVEKKFEFAQWRPSTEQVLVVERPGISEAHVRMGFVGPKRKIPEFYDLRVAETILSGYFASRMFDVIREKLNLTYGISAGFSFGLTTGTFVVSTSTRNEKLGVLITEVRKLLREFVEAGVTDDELRMAKDYITGSFPLGLQNRYVIAGTFFHGVLNGLEPEFMDVFQERINAVTKASLHAAVKKYFKLDELITVVAGDAKAIAKPLKTARIPYLVRKPQLYL